MALNPTKASNIIYGARVSDDSALPLFSEAMPALIDPDLLRYIDTFRRNGSLAGTPPEQGTPALNWSGGASVEGDAAGGGAKVTAATASTGNGVWIASGADGEVMGLVTIGELAGSVGVVFRCVTTSGNHWRAILNAATNQASLQCRGATSRTYSVTLPEPLVVGQTYPIRVEFDGPVVRAHIAGAVIELEDATQYETTSGTGIFFLSSAAPSLHRVLSCYIA